MVAAAGATRAQALEVLKLASISGANDDVLFDQDDIKKEFSFDWDPDTRTASLFVMRGERSVILDVEIIFLYPFTTIFRGLAAYGLVAMGLFLLVLLVPFAYLLSTGALDWGPVKQVAARAGTTILRAVGMPGRDGLDPADPNTREPVPHDAPEKAA
jgi:hypothetical protein